MAKYMLAIVQKSYLALFVLLLISAGSTVQAQEAATELTGEASVVIFDDYLTGKSELRYYLIDRKKNKETRVFFGADAPDNFKTGKKFKVRGRGHARGLDVQTLTPLQESGSSSSPDNSAEAPVANAETRNVLTILVDFNDAYVDGAGMSYGISLQEAKDRMFNQTKNVAGLFYNASLGTLTIPADPDNDGTEDVFGPYQINDSYIGGDSNQCSPSTWVNLASAAWEAANPDKDISLYRHRHLIVPNYWDWGNRHCGWGGVAQVGCGTWCWAIGADPDSVFHGVTVHELGHNLGFNHARTDPDNDGYNNGDSEYGDSSDMMGGSRNWMKFNAPHAEDKGWVDPSAYEFRTVVPSASLQSFELLAMDEEAAKWPGLRALKLPRTSNTDYYFTWRLQAGDYNNVTSSYANRVNIHYGFDNSTYSYYVGTLAAGESFIDTYNNVTVTATSAVEITHTDGVTTTDVMGVEVCDNACSSIPAPSNLSATATSTNQINLAWNDNSDTEDGFDVERSADGSSWFPHASLGVNATAYNDSGLNPASTWFYRVRAFNTEENSGYSNTASDTTFDVPPAAPTGLAASAASQSQINVSWADNAGNESGYRVERSDDGAGGWSQVADLGANATSYNDTGLPASTEYFYRAYAHNGAGNSAVSNTDNATTDDPPAFIDQSSTGSTTQEGTVSGSHTNTHDDDDVVQSITEQESNGNPARRRSSLQHRWTFNVSAGTGMTLTANAWVSGPTDVDGYTFAYSTDASNYTDLFTVSSTADTNVQMAALPAVRVVDTDNSQGERVLGQLSVDFLQIRTDNQPVTPPAAPTGLGATATAHNQIDLVWTDVASDETGYEVERAGNVAGPWNTLMSLPSGANSYSDGSVSEQSTYYYRVRAMKGATPSGYSNTDFDTTPEAPVGAIGLTANGYKVKGKHHVDLTWSGNAGNVDVYRDGDILVNPDGSDVGGSTLTDPIGAKGGANYDYKVCETGTSVCSLTETVVF
jgi:hypothetical protein